MLGSHDPSTHPYLGGYWHQATVGGGTVLASLWTHLLSCLETAGWAGALGEDVGSPEGSK